MPQDVEATFTTSASNVPSAISYNPMDPIIGEIIECPESMIRRIIGVDDNTIKGIQKKADVKQITIIQWSETNGKFTKKKAESIITGQLSGH